MGRRRVHLDQLALWAALAVVALGCDDVAKAPPALEAQTGNATVVQAPVATTPPQAGEATAGGASAAAKEPMPVAREEIDEARTKADSAQFRELLNRGREQVKAGEIRAGMATFEEALKLDPNDATVLSELGWAALKHNDLERALTATRASIRNSLDPGVLGASYYNLGRIHEARGELDAAATAYTRSLEVRPENATVQKRLAELEARGAEAAEANAQCAFDQMSGEVPEVARVCEVFLARSQGSEGLECEAAALRGTKVGDATLVPFRYWHHDRGRRIYDAIAVLKPEGWWVHDLAAYEELAVGYNGQEGQIAEIRAEEILGGGQPEAIITYWFSFYDGDYARNAVEGYQEKAVMAIEVAEGVPRFLGSFLVEKRQDIGPLLEGESSEVEEAVLIDEAARVRFEPGEAVVEAVEGKRSPSPEGRFGLGSAPRLCYAAMGYGYQI